ncbi:MAG: DUF362 domain-containing protein [bacterium]|nr:DUF362 domain-containing protein [Candidatus Sumerlaeota bacterium]
MHHSDETAIDTLRQLNRRKFMLRLAKAGGAIVAAGGLAYLFHDPKGPDARPPQSKSAPIELPDYSAAQAGKKMAVARGADRAQTLNSALKALGGIEAFIKKGDCVLLKVNAAFASPPILSATTHPEVVREMVKLCFQAGASEVRVTDNSINDPDSCFRLSGIAEATEQSGGTLFLPNQRYFKPFTLENAALIRQWPLLYTPLHGVNKLIGIAPVKDHHRAGASMTMKNWYGLLGGRRNIFHQDINTIIAELAMMVKPTLVILDGTTAMMTNGPTGGATSDLKQTNTMIVSTDQVAADAFGATLLGRQISDLPYIGKAASAGCGVSDYQSLKPIEVS